tara:strand:+ start:313 stop:6093 length:5781 start_codon:yes stop_codon:yes gene_type:complete
MATGAHTAISAYDNTGTQSLASTNKITSDSMSVFWNKNDTTKQIIHGVQTKQIPSSIATRDTSWGGTQIFEVPRDLDALGNIHLSVIIELDTPPELNHGPPETITTLLRRPSTKESITLWDLTEPIMYRIRGIAKESKTPKGVQIGYPNGWREDIDSPNYPSSLNNIHPFMQPQDLPKYPEWDYKPRDFLQLTYLEINRTSRPNLNDFLEGTTYFGGNTKEYLFNPDMRISKHAKLDLFSDREEYSLGDPRPMGILMNGYYSRTLKESPGYIGFDNLISDSLVPSVYQATYRPHDLSYIPKYLSHNNSRKLRKTGNEHFDVNSDGTYSLYSSPGVLADDFFISYLTVDDIVKLVDYYNDSSPPCNLTASATDSSGTFSCGDRIEWLKANMGMTDSAARQQVAQEFPDICGPCSSEIRPINKITTPPDNRSNISSEYTGLPGTETSQLFGSQDGKSPLGWPNLVRNHTFDKGEYLFNSDGQFISNNTENPSHGSFSYSLEKIDPIPDVKDVSPSHQNYDYYGYATVISKDGKTIAVGQGRMYGCEQTPTNQTIANNLMSAAATKTAQSNPPDQYWPYGQEDAPYNNEWDTALNSGVILFPLNAKRAGKVRVYKKKGDEWVLSKTFGASESNLAAYPYGAKNIKRPGAQEYIYVDPINPHYISSTSEFPVLKQKTPWAPGCKHHISLSGDGSRIVIGEAGGPNNFVSTYDYNGDDWVLVDTKISGAAALGGVSDASTNIEQYYHRGVYTGNYDYTFNYNNFGIHPLPDSVWGSGFGNNVELSYDGNILAVTSYKSIPSVFKWNPDTKFWDQMGSGITSIADSLSMSNDGKTLVTSNFTSNYAHVWEYDLSSDTWSSSDFIPLRHFLPDTEINFPRGTSGANNALEDNWTGAAALVAEIAQGPGGGGDTINSSPVRISGDGSRIGIGSPRAFGDDSQLEPALLKIYTKLSRINSGTPYTPPGPGHPNWVQLNDSTGNPQQLLMEPGEFSISDNGMRIVVGEPISNTILTPHLPEFPSQLMLLGLQQERISKEYPWTSSSNISESKRPKLEAGKIKIYDNVGSDWIEPLAEINGESGEINEGDSHSHTSSQNFHNMFLATGGGRQGETVTVVPPQNNAVSFSTPAQLSGSLNPGTSMTIAATCKFNTFGTGDWPNTLAQGPIVTLGSSGPYGRFSIIPLDFDTSASNREWDLIGVTFHAAPQILIAGSTWAATTVTGGYIYPPVPGMNEQYYPPTTKVATQLGSFLAHRGDTNFYVVSKIGFVISFYVNGNLIGSHDYQDEETGYGAETYGTQSHIGWDGVSEYINGEVTNIGVWDGGLTADEVKTIYNGDAKFPILTNGLNATLVYSEYESVITQDIAYKIALYNSIRYDGELSTKWEKPWHQYGGIDFLTNYFSVYGGYDYEPRDYVYSGNNARSSEEYRGSKGESLGWSISLSGDGNTIISGAPYMSTIGTTVANPRRSYRDVGRAYVFGIERIDKTIHTLGKRNPGSLRMTYEDGFKIVNESQIKLNHDITDFVNLPSASLNSGNIMSWKRQWDTVPDQAVNPPNLEDYTDPYWAKSELKSIVKTPLANIIKRVYLQVGSQIWQTLENSDIEAINATELSESAYRRLQQQCSGLVRSDGQRETIGDPRWVPGKKYQAIIPIPLLCSNQNSKLQNYNSHDQNCYLKCLAKEQEVKIIIEYSNLTDIFNTNDVYAYQGYRAPIYTLTSSDQIGNYISNVPVSWNPNIKLICNLYGQYISIAEEEKTFLKNKPERIYKKIKNCQNITFTDFPEILYKDTYVDVRIDTFTVYSSHLIIYFDFPGITNPNKIPRLSEAEVTLNGTTHSGKVPVSSLLTSAKTLGLYSNDFIFDKENFGKTYYIFPLASKAFGGSSIALNRFDDVIIRFFFTVDGGIKNEGLVLPGNSKVSITCRGETNMFYNKGISAITLF